MNSKTPNFLAFLHHNRLVDVLSIPRDDDLGFVNRLKLQKLIYFAQKRFNLPTNYSYSLYKNGVYSPDLTDDYYQIDPMEIENFNPDEYISYSLPEEFNENRFISIFHEKSASWLEIGSTIIHFNDKRIFPVKENIINEVKDEKPRYSYTDIMKVYEDLHREKLISNMVDEIKRINQRSPDLFNALAKEDQSLIKNL